MLENAPEYAAKLEKVWLWEEWPGREGRQHGEILRQHRDSTTCSFPTRLTHLPHAFKPFRMDAGIEWARLDSNQGPTDYESAALTS